METNLSLLRDERAEALQEIKILADTVETEGRSFNDDELTRYDELDAKQEELQKQIATLERAEKAKALLPDKKEQKSVGVIRSHKRQPTKVDHNNVVKAWLSYGKPISIRDEWRRSADLLNIDYTARELILRDQTSDVAGEGGYLDNDSLFMGLVDAKKAFGGIESVAHVFNTATGEPLHFATVDDTSNVAAVSAQAETVSNTGFTFGKTSLGCFTYKTATYPISVELLQDAQFDVGGFIGRELGRRIARATNAAFTTGAGTSGARGVMQDTVAGVTLTTTTIAKEDLYDLYFAVDQEYRNSPQCAWMMADSTLAVLLEALEDTTGRPLVGQGIAGQPFASLMGKPVVINNDMDGVALGNKPIAFGDYYHFKIRYAGPVRIVRDESRFIDQLAVGVFGWVRTDSQLVDPSGTDAQAPVKHLEMTASSSSA